MFQKYKKVVLVVGLLSALMLSAFDVVENAELSATFEGEGRVILLQADGDSEEDAYCAADAEREHPGLTRLARIYDADYETLQAWYCDGGNDVGVIKQVLAFVAGQDEEDPEATLYTAEEIFAMLEAAGGDWDAVKAALEGTEAEDDGDPIDDLEDVEDEGEESARGYYCREGTENEHPSLANVAEVNGLDYAAVQEWFCEGGHGVGSIKNVLKAGESGDLSAEELFAMYEEYGNWGQVKKALREGSAETSESSDAAPGNSGNAPGKDKDKGKPDKNKDKGKPDGKPGKGSNKGDD